MATNGGELTTNGERGELRPDVWSSRLGGEASEKLQESSNMSGENKGGSDLDIFEGLGKKNSQRPPAAVPAAPPSRVPAPPSPVLEAAPEAVDVSRPATNAPPATASAELRPSDAPTRVTASAAPPPGAFPGGPVGAAGIGLNASESQLPPPAKRTLLGIPAVSSPTSSAPPPPPASSLPAPGSMRPPPPPGRGTLPQVVPPPPKTGVGLGAAPGPATSSQRPPPMTPPASSSGIPAMTAPNSPLLDSRASVPNPAKSKGAGLDMDWDDEDEATHIFDKDKPGDEPVRVDRPRPNAGAMMPTPNPGAAAQSRTLLGLTGPASAPPPPPSMRPSNPPPGGLGGAFARPPVSSPPPAPNGSGFDALSQPASPSAPPGLIMNPQMGQPAAQPAANGFGQAAYAPTQPSNVASHAMPEMPPVQAVPNRMEMTALVRPQAASRTGLFIGLGAVGAALVVGALFLVMMPHTGSVRIDVTDDKGATVEKVDIAIDGRKQCDTTPCIVDQLSSGSHVVKVSANGFEASPPTREVVIDARKQTPLAISLTATAPKTTTGLKVSGAQSGVKLYVDDKEIGPVPQEVKELEAGTHKIKLAGSDRYAPFEKTVTVAKDEMVDLGAPTLKVVKGKATISLATAGAKVYLVSGSDRRELPTLPIQVDIDTSKSWTLEASKLGMADYKQPISFDDGQAEKTFAVSLENRGAAAPAAAAPAAAAPAAVAAAPKAAAPAAPKAPAPAPAAAEPKAAPASADTATGESFLNINSIPPSSVVLDGKPLGNTPKVKVSVKPGTHTVLFVNADEGLKKTVSVTVGAGETKAAIAKLRD